MITTNRRRARMDEETKIRVGLSVAAIAMGWVILLGLPTVDGSPKPEWHFWLWIAVNLVAMVKVYGWLRRVGRRS
jgi:hypothetical protein